MKPEDDVNDDESQPNSSVNLGSAKAALKAVLNGEVAETLASMYAKFLNTADLEALSPTEEVMMAGLHSTVLKQAVASLSVDGGLKGLERILLDMRRFIKEEIEPHNPDNMFVEDMMKAVKAMLDR